MRRRLSATVVALLVLVGCESAGDDEGETPAATTAETASPVPTSSEAPMSEEPSSEEPTSDDATEEPSESGTGDATSTGDTDDIPTDPDPDRYPWVSGPVEQDSRTAD
ncbi:hypothetical protein [Ornithinimicrobium cerasi]|uniref:Uncharacterized protein n=1 Tax=Ornithinimicrobium cerasi TaxID=2248773 RepID=A0A285VTA2_9MICO|nr:hypothetical protein [Ornithinimicrobium cerasi]SOC57314.1 hypothetical protein SAMN05421879_11221 [Ornithinimicrobium cerasi]